MFGYFKEIKKFPIRLIPLAVCAMILTSALSIYFTIQESNQYEQTNSIIQKNKKDMEWKLIEDLLNSNYDIAKEEARVNAIELEYSLRYNYPNMDELEEQFNKGEYSNEFNTILTDIIRSKDQKSEFYLTLVGTRKYLISMYSNTDSHSLGNIDSSKQVTWEHIAKISNNPELTTDAIQAVLKKDNRMIYIVSDESNFDSVNNMTQVTNDGLKKLYYSSGRDALKSISLLAPAYITDSGDIFGTEDKTFLKSNDNNKLIIVKSVNVGEIINNNELYIDSVISSIDSLSDTVSDQGRDNILQSILWSFIIFLLSMFLIAVFNSEERKGHLYENGNDADDK